MKIPMYHCFLDIVTLEALHADRKHKDNGPAVRVGLEAISELCTRKGCFQVYSDL